MDSNTLNHRSKKKSHKRLKERPKTGFTFEQQKADNYSQNYTNNKDQNIYSPTQALNFFTQENQTDSYFVSSAETAIEPTDIKKEKTSETLDKKENEININKKMGIYKNTKKFQSTINKTIILYQLWLFSHLLTLTTFLWYFRNVNCKKNINWKYNNKLYITSLFSSITTYSLVLYRIYNTKLQSLAMQTTPTFENDSTFSTTSSTMTAILPLSALFQTENFHLVINCILFLLNYNMKSMWKLLSFAVFSFLNLGNFICYELYSSNNSEKTLNSTNISGFEKIVDAFRPLLHLIATPLLGLITVIDFAQFSVIYFVDIKKSQSARQTLLGQVILLGYGINYLLRLEYMENSRYTINFIVNWSDYIIGEKLFEMMTRINGEIKIENKNDIDSEVMDENSEKGEDSNENSNRYKEDKSIVAKVGINMSQAINSLWFNWIRHGINILVPLKNVDEKILQNQFNVITNQEYQVFKQRKYVE
ncbi:hypothetical protein HANVADRAFT_8167 [Hanseniaspora valbyensis NRRL Y-1626]|uniref:Uncharacterized protein n=1 Tax=Hanseniaspora valbyensis NRRL Y-1626 TaxID=766949 RepID=A0A1B7T924_9ASCO|nr:hypothetical protein HANVADRAFT_8167 [Hanseniaspora valbyensis NRRL Y-1626]